MTLDLVRVLKAEDGQTDPRMHACRKDSRSMPLQDLLRMKGHNPWSKGGTHFHRLSSRYFSVCPQPNRISGFIWKWIVKGFVRLDWSAFLLHLGSFVFFMIGDEVTGSGFVCIGLTKIFHARFGRQAKDYLKHVLLIKQRCERFFIGPYYFVSFRFIAYFMQLDSSSFSCRYWKFQKFQEIVLFFGWVEEIFFEEYCYLWRWVLPNHIGKALITRCCAFRCEVVKQTKTATCI